MNRLALLYAQHAEKKNSDGGGSDDEQNRMDFFALDFDMRKREKHRNYEKRNPIECVETLRSDMFEVQFRQHNRNGYRDDCGQN